jgi:periplasmic protein TonB
MKLFEVHSGSIDELVFENRNKNYGAYFIRKNYNHAVFKSLFILGSGLATLCLSLLFYINHKPNSDIKNILLPDLTDPKVYIEKTIDLSPVAEKPIQKQEATAAPSSGIATRIVDNPLVTNTVNLNNPEIGNVNLNSNGTSLTSTLVGTNTLVTTEPDIIDKTIYNVVQEMPEFEGGVSALMKFIAQNINYPYVAKEAGKEGTVHVSFVVNETGIVENISIIRGIGFGCDEEVVRVISKIPKWKKVGKNSGRAVKVRFNVPVKFKIQ